MIIKNAKFLKSESRVTANYEGFGLPEIAVVGRSNVGKSSFINMLANNKKLAKTSSTPGRTRLVNYFLFNNEFVLVDLPGYGFAKASKAEQSGWENMITSYFAETNNLVGIILLVDIRHTPTVQDKEMLAYLYAYNIPVIIACTKQDKIKRSEMARKVMDISSTLMVGRENIIVTSSETKYGKEQICDKMQQLIDNAILNQSADNSYCDDCSEPESVNAKAGGADEDICD